MTKSYIKKLEGVSAQYPVETYEKYKYFSELFTKVQGIDVPRVLKHDAKSIEFEFVDLSRVVADFYIPGQVHTKEFYTIGDKVAHMHQVLEQEGSGYVHGDMTPFNVMVKGAGIVIFDMEAPKSCNNFYYYYKGDRHIDIATFVFWTMLEGWRSGGYVKSLGYRYSLVRAFLRGYTNCLTVSKFDLLVALFIELKRFICTLRHR